MTLGNAAAAHLRLIVWCRDCRHQLEPKWPTGYGSEITVPDWRKRLVYSRCGSREIHMAVSAQSRETMLPVLRSSGKQTIGGIAACASAIKSITKSPGNSVQADRLLDPSSTASTMRNTPTECRDRSQAITASILVQGWPRLALSSCGGLGVDATNS